jgi:hypothetical protein
LPEPDTPISRTIAASGMRIMFQIVRDA